jgi:hypothetical protein
MTLLGAFQINNTPILISDYLVTTGGSSPTYRTRRKIVKLADNCVLGWCGSEFVAHSVLKKLFQGLRYDRYVDNIEHFSKTLIELKDHEFSAYSAIFIGWLIDREGCHCLRWRSDYPGSVFLDDETQQSQHFDGSGEDTLRQFLRDCTSHGSIREPLLESETHHQIGILMARLTEDEFYNNSGHLGSRTYGFGYETAIYTGSAFEFFPDYCFIILQLHLADDNSLVQVSEVEPVIKHQSREYFAELVFSHKRGRKSERHFMLPPGLKTSGYDERNPAIKRRWDDIQREVRQTNYFAEVYLLCFEVFKMGSQIGTITAVQTSASEEEFRVVEHSYIGNRAQLTYNISQTLIDSLCERAVAVRRGQIHTAEEACAPNSTGADVDDKSIEVIRATAKFNPIDN